MSRKADWGNNICLVCAACVSLLLLSAAVQAYSNWSMARFDVDAYWDAGVAIREGHSLYVSSTSAAREKVYLYSPTFAAIFALVTLLDRPFGLALWWSVQLLGLAGLLFATKTLIYADSRFVEHKRSISGSALLTLLIIIFPAAVANFAEGQVNILVSLLIACAFLLHEREIRYCSGALLALGALIKLNPLIVVLLLFRREVRRELLSFVLTTAALLCLPALWRVGVTGFAQSISYAVVLNFEYLRRIVIPAISAHTISGSLQYFAPNFSLPAALGRLFGSGVQLSPFSESDVGPLISPVSETMRYGLVLVLGIIAVCFILWRYLRMKSNDLRFSEYGAALFLVTMLCLPSCWEHYLIFLPLPLALIYRDGSSASRKQLCLVIAILFVSHSLPFFLQFVSDCIRGPQFSYYRLSRLYGAPTVALLGLFGVLLSRINRFAKVETH